MTTVRTGEDTPGPANSAWQLMRTNGPLRALFAARVISYGGDSITLVALMLYVAATTGQGLAVALLLLVTDFVPSLFSPLTGAISDRFDRRRVMIWCELAQAALIVMIALSLPPLPLLLALVGLRAVANQIFMPASRAAIPALVAERDLPTANSAMGFGANCAEAFGPFVAAGLLPWLHTRGVLLADAATFVVSAALLRTMPVLVPEPDGSQDNGTGGPSLLAQARSGLGYLVRTPAIRIIAIGFCGVVAFNGIDDVALVLLAKDTLGAGDSAVGILLGAVGIGLLVGYGLLTRYGSRASLTMLLLAGFLISSAGNFLTGFAWAVAAAFSVQAIRGLGLAAMDVATNTMLQQMVPSGMLGRVFGNLYGAIGVAAAVSYVGGGLLLDATDAPTTLIVAGTGGMLVTLAVALTLPQALRRYERERSPIAEH